MGMQSMSTAPMRNQSRAATISGKVSIGNVEAQPKLPITPKAPGGKLPKGITSGGIIPGKIKI